MEENKIIKFKNGKNSTNGPNQLPSTGHISFFNAIKGATRKGDLDQNTADAHNSPESEKPIKKMAIINFNQIKGMGIDLKVIKKAIAKAKNNSPENPNKNLPLTTKKNEESETSTKVASTTIAELASKTVEDDYCKASSGTKHLPSKSSVIQSTQLNQEQLNQPATKPIESVRKINTNQIIDASKLKKLTNIDMQILKSAITKAKLNNAEDTNPQQTSPTLSQVTVKLEPQNTTDLTNNSNTKKKQTLTPIRQAIIANLNKKIFKSFQEKKKIQVLSDVVVSVPKFERTNVKQIGPAVAPQMQTPMPLDNEIKKIDQQLTTVIKGLEKDNEPRNNVIVEQPVLAPPRYAAKTYSRQFNVVHKNIETNAVPVREYIPTISPNMPSISPNMPTISPNMPSFSAKKTYQNIPTVWIDGEDSLNDIRLRLKEEMPFLGFTKKDITNSSLQVKRLQKSCSNIEKSIEDLRARRSKPQFPITKFPFKIKNILHYIDKRNRETDQTVFKDAGPLDTNNIEWSLNSETGTFEMALQNAKSTRNVQDFVREKEITPVNESNVSGSRPIVIEIDGNSTTDLVTQINTLSEKTKSPAKVRLKEKPVQIAQPFVEKLTIVDNSASIIQTIVIKSEPTVENNIQICPLATKMVQSGTSIASKKQIEVISNKNHFQPTTKRVSESDVTDSKVKPIKSPTKFNPIQNTLIAKKLNTKPKGFLSDEADDEISDVEFLGTTIKSAKSAQENVLGGKLGSLNTIKIYPVDANQAVGTAELSPEQKPILTENLSRRAFIRSSKFVYKNIVSTTDEESEPSIKIRSSRVRRPKARINQSLNTAKESHVDMMKRLKSSVDICLDHNSLVYLDATLEDRLKRLEQNVANCFHPRCKVEIDPSPSLNLASNKNCDRTQLLPSAQATIEDIMVSAESAASRAQGSSVAVNSSETQSTHIAVAAESTNFDKLMDKSTESTTPINQSDLEQPFTYDLTNFSVASSTPKCDRKNLSSKDKFKHSKIENKSLKSLVKLMSQHIDKDVLSKCMLEISKKKFADSSSDSEEDNSNDAGDNCLNNDLEENNVPVSDVVVNLSDKLGQIDNNRLEEEACDLFAIDTRFEELQRMEATLDEVVTVEYVNSCPEPVNDNNFISDSIATDQIDIYEIYEHCDPSVDVPNNIPAVKEKLKKSTKTKNKNNSLSKKVKLKKEDPKINRLKIYKVQAPEKAIDSELQISANISLQQSQATDPPVQIDAHEKELNVNQATINKPEIIIIQDKIISNDPSNLLEIDMISNEIPVPNNELNILDLSTSTQHLKDQQSCDFTVNSQIEKEIIDVEPTKPKNAKVKRKKAKKSEITKTLEPIEQIEILEQKVELHNVEYDNRINEQQPLDKLNPFILDESIPVPQMLGLRKKVDLNTVHGEENTEKINVRRISVRSVYEINDINAETNQSINDLHSSVSTNNCRKSRRKVTDDLIQCTAADDLPEKRMRKKIDYSNFSGSESDKKPVKKSAEKSTTKRTSDHITSTKEQSKPKRQRISKAKKNLEKIESTENILPSEQNSKEIKSSADNLVAMTETPHKTSTVVSKKKPIKGKCGKQPKYQTEIYSGPEQNSYICGNCNEQVEGKGWKKHLLFHYGLAWRVGFDGAIDMNNFNFKTAKMLNFLKDNGIKKLKCFKCPDEKRSAIGYLSHIETCGLTEDELNVKKIKCDYCAALLLPVSMQTHLDHHCSGLKSIRMAEKSLKLKESDEQTSVVDSSGRFVRKSAIAALNSFKQVDAEVRDERVDDFIRKITQVTGGTIKGWRLQLSTKGIIKCSRVECSFATEDLEAINKHHHECVLNSVESYYCSRCNFGPNERQIIYEHVEKMHSLEKYKTNKYFDSDSDSEVQINENDSLSESAESESGDEEIESNAETCSDDDNNNDNDDDNKRIKRQRNLQTSSENGFDRQILADQIFDLRVYQGKYFKPSIEWTRDFRENNYSAAPLYTWAIPNKFKLTKSDHLTEYLPSMIHSNRFYATTKEAYHVKFNTIKSLDTDWLTLQRFSGQNNRYSMTIFCGGPVMAMEWLPLPDDRSASQYLAICCKIDPNLEVFKMKHKQEKCLIQFWNMSNLQNSNLNCESNEPYLMYGITYDYGPIMSMKFCPSGGYTDDRFGLLAVPTTRGDVHILSLPKNYNCDNTKLADSKLFISIEPSIVLCSQLCKSASYKITKIEWSRTKDHALIIAGYTTGLVIIWNLATSSPLLHCMDLKGSKQLMPTQMFYATQSPITQLDFHQDNNNESRWLLVGGHDRKSKVFDLQQTQPFEMSMSFIKSRITGGCWPLHWTTFFVTIDNSYAYSNSAGVIIRHPLEIGCRPGLYFSCIGTILDVSFNDWLNTVMQCSNTGEIYVAYPKQLLSSFLDSRRKRGLLSYTEIIDLEETKTDSKESIAPYLSNSKYNNFRYPHDKGIIFCDFETPDPWKTSPTFDICRTYPVPKYNICKVNKVAYNSNAESYKWYAIGYESGFVRIRYMKPMK